MANKQVETAKEAKVVVPQTPEVVEAQETVDEASGNSVEITPERLEVLRTKGSMAEIKPVINRIIDEQNSLYIEGLDSKAHAWDKVVEELVNRYTADAKFHAFLKCKQDPEGPMMSAVKTLTFDSIRVKDEKDSSSDLITRKIVDVEKDIDLLQLHKEVKGGIGVDKTWLYQVQKLNYLMHVKVSKAVDKDWTPDKVKELKDNFIMDKIAEDFKFGEKDPVSNTQILKTMNAIVAAMIGPEYKTNSHAIAYVAEAYSKADKSALTIQLPNHKTFTRLMRDVCHEAIEKCGFKVISKCVKKK